MKTVIYKNRSFDESQIMDLLERIIQDSGIGDSVFTELEDVQELESKIDSLEGRIDELESIINKLRECLK